MRVVFACLLAGFGLFACASEESSTDATPIFGEGKHSGHVLGVFEAHKKFYDLAKTWLAE